MPLWSNIELLKHLGTAAMAAWLNAPSGALVVC